MTKHPKPKSKSKTKTNPVVQPETPAIITKKSYWIMLTIFMTAIFSIIGYIMNFGITNVIILAFTIAFLLSLMGYVSTTPSNMSKSKRATFLFVGASIIGFCIWAVIFLTLPTIDLIDTNALTDIFLVFSFIICLTLGAFIGELMGKNQKIQNFFFKSQDIPQ